MSRAQDRLRAVAGDQLVRLVAGLVTVLRQALPAQVVATYVVGSVANGDHRGPASDLDLIAIVDGSVERSVLEATGAVIADVAATGPLRGVELVVYRAEVTAHPTYPLPYELNVNAGWGMARRVETGGNEPFWFLLDLAAAREHALVVHGPAVVDTIAVVPDALVVHALADALAWHASNGGNGPDVVLNACRAWHWLEHRRWLSKTAAGEWAVREHAPEVVDIVRKALALRARGLDEALDPSSVAALVSMVTVHVRAAG